MGRTLWRLVAAFSILASADGFTSPPALLRLQGPRGLDALSNLCTARFRGRSYVPLMLRRQDRAGPESDDSDPSGTGTMNRGKNDVTDFTGWNTEKKSVPGILNAAKEVLCPGASLCVSVPIRRPCRRGSTFGLFSLCPPLLVVPLLSGALVHEMV